MAAPDYKHYEGSRGQVEIGEEGSEAIVLGTLNWKASVKRETLDATDQQSAGWDEHIRSNRNWTATFEFEWHSGQDVTGLLGLLNGDDAYVHFTGTMDTDKDNPGTVDGYGTVDGFDKDVPVKGIIKFTVSVKGTGPLTVTLTADAAVPPVAAFSGTPTSGSTPLPVQFTDESTNYPTAWSWDFGDGSELSNSKNPLHLFVGAASYTVKLTVSNAAGADDEEKVEYIVVSA